LFGNSKYLVMINADEDAAGAIQIPLELAREIARQGEVRLTAITSLATAADLRATTLCGIFGAASVALAAAVLASITAGNHPIGLMLAGSVLAVGFFGSALTAAHAGAPRNFFVGGGNPEILREWSWSGDRWRSELEMLDATAGRYAASIETDRELLELNSKRLIRALWIAGSSLLIAPLTFVGFTILF
jgi:hypothetical protein